MSDFTAQLQHALSPGYALERELTGGGMSRVFVATDTALGRQVVVKVLPPELAAGVNHERFRREIQVAAQLQHPHIVPLLSAGEQGTLIWYTMPYINGHSLRDALQRGERFAIKDVVRIMRDVAEALDYAHGLGVIHRDIKPGNVLLMANWISTRSGCSATSCSPAWCRSRRTPRRRRWPRNSRASPRRSRIRAATCRPRSRRSFVTCSPSCPRSARRSPPTS